MVPRGVSEVCWSFNGFTRTSGAFQRVLMAIQGVSVAFEWLTSDFRSTSDVFQGVSRGHRNILMALRVFDNISGAFQGICRAFEKRSKWFQENLKFITRISRVFQWGYGRFKTFQVRF